MIKDKMQLQGFGNIKLPKIKGEVEIRLHNPTTGKTEIHRGENIVTNAVSDIFANNICGMMDYSAMLPLYEKMFGGILCFKEQLNVDTPTVDAAKADYFIPDNSNDQAVTAHAGQSTVSDQSDDPTRGSMSANNMSVADGTVKLAWEWGLSEGNGKISALALTHTDVGTGGTGVNSNAFKGITTNINATAVDATPRIMFYDANGYGYTVDFSNSGTTCTITRYPMVYRQVGLIEQVNSCISGMSETRTVNDLVNIGGDYPFFFFDKTTSKLYTFYNGGDSPSSTVYVNIINLSNWNSVSASTTTWSNLDEPVGPLRHYGRDPYMIQLAYDGTYVYLPAFASLAGNTRYLLRVEVSATSHQKKFTPASAFKCASGIFVPDRANRVIAGKGFVINNEGLYQASIASPDGIYVGIGDASIQNSNMENTVGLVQMTNRQQYASLIQHYPSVSKFYLATKFNLNSAVTKQSSQSMIVTYTLSEVAPNE